MTRIPNRSIREWLESSGRSLDDAFTVFAEQDSGSVSYGLEVAGRDWFVKMGTTESARESLATAFRFHEEVEHSTIVRPVMADIDGGALVYPWVDRDVLNHATIHRSDRSALTAFRLLPVSQITRAITDVLDAHRVVETYGFVAVDFYDGTMLYDFDGEHMHLIDLDEYRPGPFIVHGERMPGSRSFMAPEEWQRGATVDRRTTVFTLGRAIGHLLRSNDGEWRGPRSVMSLVGEATQSDPAARYQSVRDLHHEWMNLIGP